MAVGKKWKRRKEQSEPAKLGVHAGIGAAAGAGVVAATGLTAVGAVGAGAGIGAAAGPVGAAVRALGGLAVYGVKKAFKRKR